MLNNDSKPQRALSQTVEQTIHAYDMMRIHCLHQLKHIDCVDTEDRLMQTIWECDATISSLKAALARLNPTDNTTQNLDL